MKFHHIIAGVALLLSSSFASALMISVSDISITDGSSKKLTWSTTERSDFSFELSGASTQTFGTFTTYDFPIGFKDDVDVDPIEASFTLTPPGADVSSHGEVKAKGFFKWWVDDSIKVDFDNSWIDMVTYEVKFRDLTIKKDGTYNLTARFREIPGATAVPEPSTIALLGLGLLGLGIARRKQSA